MDNKESREAAPNLFNGVVLLARDYAIAFNEQYPGTLKKRKEITGYLVREINEPRISGGHKAMEVLIEFPTQIVNPAFTLPYVADALGNPFFDFPDEWKYGDLVKFLSAAAEVSLGYYKAQDILLGGGKGLETGRIEEFIQKLNDVGENPKGKLNAFQKIFKFHANR